MTRHAIYGGPDGGLAFEWTPRPWPGESLGPDALPAERNSPIPPGWTVAAVFDVQEPEPWNISRLAVVASDGSGPSWELLSPLGERAYSPQDVLRGEVPPGVTVLWIAPPVPILNE